MGVLSWEEINLYLAFALFAINILDDALAVLYVRRTAEGKALQAALISGALTMIVAFSVVSYVEDRRYLVPIVLGSVLGSYLGVRWDKAYRRKKYGRKKEKQAKEGT